MIAVIGVLLCGCCLVGDWKGELLRERAKVGRIRLLRVEKLLMKWRKAIKGTEASELEKETDWVGNETGQQKV